MTDSHDNQSGMVMFPDPINPDNPGRGPLVLGLIWTFGALALIVVSVRIWVRMTVMKALVVEDWLMIAAVALNTVCISFLTIACHYGLGKHGTDLTFDQTVNTVKWMWLNSTPGILCSILARISIAILLIRIFGRKVWLKWFLIVITTLQVVGSVMVIVLVLVQVRPLEGLWNPLIKSEHMDPLISTRTGNVVGALYALGDLLYVLLPVMVIWNLNMPPHKKAGLCFLLALSLFTMAASIAKAIYAGSTEDAVYDGSLSGMWAAIEQEFVVMMGCAPTLSSITKLNLKLPSVLSISVSFRRLVSSRGTGYGMQASNEPGQSCDRIHTDDLGVKGTDSARGSSRDHDAYQLWQVDGHSIGPEHVRSEDQYHFTAGQK